MKFLIDTHVFMWWDSQSAQLSATAKAAISDPNNSVFLSVASLWEILIKTQANKLQIGGPLIDAVNRQRAQGIQLLDISLAHVMVVGSLPNIHRDPFDRILIAQALAENASLVSADHMIAQYPVPLVY